MNRARGGAVLRILLILVLVVAVVAGGLLWHDFSHFSNAGLAVRGDNATVNIARGSSFKQIVHTLRARHLSAAPTWYWRMLAMRMGVTGKLHAGEYALSDQLTPRQLLENMARGKVVQHDVTIVDGWNFKQLRHHLDKTPKLVHDSAKLSDGQLMQRIGAAGEKPEGRFLPETYAYVKGDSDLDVLKRAHAAMGKLLATQWPKRDKDLPLDSPYQALILASIVEKETARSDERARIAGVFVRRLRLGMPLGTDPTVIYGMGSSYHGNIRKSDLEADTPYNTYLHAGLPPTPIALPGKAAIVAALHPAPGKALYFVARGDGSGSHVFSATLAEHNRAVACYQLKRCHR